MAQAKVLICTIFLGGCVQTEQSQQYSDADFSVQPQYIRALPPLDMTAQPTEANQDNLPGIENAHYEFQLRLDTEMGVPSGDVYWADPNRNLVATFFFKNATPWDHTFTVICLVDYTQIPCQSSTPTLSVTLQAGEYQDILIEYPELSSGMHNLAVATSLHIPVPVNMASPQELDDFIVQSSSFFWSDDVTVYVGSYEAPMPQIVNFPSIPSNPNFGGSLSFFITYPNLQDLSEGIPHPNMLQAEEITGQTIRVKPGQKLNFSLIGTHDEGATYYQVAQEFDLDIDTTSLPFVVTAFVDTQSVSINSELPGGAVFGRISRGESIVIPVSFTAPNEPGLYSYFVLYQEAPFVRNGQLIPQQDGGMLYEHYVDMSHLLITNRLVFEVVSDEE